MQDIFSAIIKNVSGKSRYLEQRLSPVVRLVLMLLLPVPVWRVELEPFDRLEALSRLVRPVQLAHLALLQLEFGEDNHIQFHSQGNPHHPTRCLA